MTPRLSRRSITSGFFALAEKSIIQIFGIASFFLLLRILSPQEVGTLELFISLSVLTEMIKAGLLYAPTIKYLIEDQDLKSSVKVASLQINLLLSVSIALVLLLLSFPLARLWEADALPRMMQIYLLIAVSQAFYTHFIQLQHAEMFFKGGFWSQFLNKGAYMTLILLAFILNKKLTLETVVLFQLFGSALACITGFFFSRRQVELNLKFNKPIIAKLLGYGRYTLGTNISTVVLRNTDRWMLGSLLNTEAVALYSPSIRATNIFEVPMNSFVSVFFPNAVKRYGQAATKEVVSLYQRSVLVLLLIIVPVSLVVIAFSSEIVLFIAGAQYSESAPILQITMLYGILIVFNKQFGVIMDAIGKASLNMKIVILNVLVNIVFNWVFISKFGTIGAAYGTLCSYVIVSIVIHYVLMRKFGLSLIDYVRISVKYIKGLLAKRGNLNNG